MLDFEIKEDGVISSVNRQDFFIALNRGVRGKFKFIVVNSKNTFLINADIHNELQYTLAFYDFINKKVSELEDKYLNELISC